MRGMTYQLSRNVQKHLEVGEILVVGFKICL